MKHRILFLWVVLCFCFTLNAQDQTNFTHFYLNPYLINPSFAGVDGKTAITLIYRKQWATLEDGPQISNVSLHTPISNRVSIGFAATNDQRGLLKNTGLLMTFGYNVSFDEAASFRFGISAGASSNTIDLKRLDGFNDPAIGNLLNNNISLAGNTGISVHVKSFHVGVSLPVIFAPSYISTDAFSITEIDPFQSLIFHISNRIYFNNDRYVFEPYAVYRMSKNLPAQYELTGIVHLNHILWVGGSFKEDFGISALGGIKFKNSLAIGASYSLKTSGVNELNSPTYEVSLGLLLGNSKKERLVYSFVHTEKPKVKKTKGKSASEMIAEKRRQDEIARKKQLEEQANKKQQEIAAKQQQEEQLARKQQEAATQQRALAQKQQGEEKQKKTQTEATRKQQEQQAQTATARKNQEELARKQKEETAQKHREELSRLQQQPVVPQAEVNKANQTALAETEKQEKENERYLSSIRTDTVVLTHRPRFNHISASTEVINTEVTEHTDDDEKERISRLKLHASKPKENHDGALHPNSQRHEFAKKGNHKQELKTANYVVAGVFNEENKARQFSEGLRKLGFNADYGYSSAKRTWHVYLSQSEDIYKAKDERDKNRRMIIFRDAWLLTVEP